MALILKYPTEVKENNLKGIIYIFARIDWYWNLSSVLLMNNLVDMAFSVDPREELEKRVIDLYKALLSYQLKSVCTYFRQSGLQFLADVVQWDDWDGEFEVVHDAEYAVRHISETYNNQQIKSHLGNLEQIAKDRERELLRGIRWIQQEQFLSQMGEEVLRCLQELRTTDPRNDKKRIEDTKGGLLRDSYHWILDNVDFQQWRDDEQSQLLWIKGSPGTGKTMLLCGIINELEKSTAETGLLSYFFCQATDSRMNNATAVLRGLIYLLLVQQPLLISHVQKKYDHAGKALFEDANAWVALSEIFTNILQDPGLNSTYLIIDALDECVVDLPKLLEFIVQKSSISPRIKWVVSSRNWPDIEERLYRAGHKMRLCLELNSKSISAAVSTYIKHKTLQLAEKNRYDDRTRVAVLERLASNANDTFLWVALVCENLKNVPGWKTLAKLNEFPPGLNSLYQHMTGQIYNSDLCKQILAIMSIVYRPITLPELTSLVETLEDVSDDHESLAAIIGLCGSFLALRESTIYFIHQSAKDFLLSEASYNIFPSGIDDIHHVIFSRSLQVMSRTLRCDIYSLHAPGISVDQVKPPDPDPLAAARYSCLYWVDHLLDCNTIGNTNNDLKDGGLVDKFLCQNYLYWLEALSLIRSLPSGIVMIRKLENLLQVSFSI
jgi:hypothetical protein